MKINDAPKVKIYDADNNEIIPPEGATGWVQGMDGMAWLFDKPNYTVEFIYTPPEKESE